ncbi:MULTISPECIES: TyrS-associated PheT N-terminal domain-related protein TapR [unclassified Mycoplasma]|uniref:TyrS-associated PheT N-terminal domain-related protein TapR n=1 Tax=unclassified Mycoplasma TaxID=2683645 RepID=UPI00211CDDFD|nr:MULTISPECIES: hypothetical protein [unclassified Mycoplasma]UUM19990.1 hypothetical protein NPA11_00945 [Mycoplasma sp. 1578d]UUM24971.1 hypothetical protein NPA12_00930 [Mycoplasma sp. 3686d]
MILVHKLSDQFSNCAILTIDTSIKPTKQIKSDNYLFFVDENNKVNSINVFNNESLLNSSNKAFFALDEQESLKIKKIAHDLNLQINDGKKFVYAQIIKRNVHPKSDKLFVLTLFDNSKEFQVVTNTLDSIQGKIVAVALPGSINANGLEILDGSMLDVKSNGMLIGYASLGLQDQGLVFGDEKNIGEEVIF